VGRTLLSDAVDFDVDLDFDFDFDFDVDFDFDFGFDFDFQLDFDFCQQEYRGSNHGQNPTNGVGQACPARAIQLNSQ